ncbi:hypothetical protein GGS23DRAFT_581544 [Durotheca rogersii]|uniref:uncharacterized protein n=1 Tax=Durotheca rogersii TaxID=419775 RepID=UPI00221FE060|nr:uncharacterized protein GGS23DRAFT_581544 [Durotheca rogersii]KAI5860182.1 hypothetical protein GGS23DRAFT_581544 [Durotheca rogersii]
MCVCGVCICEYVCVCNVWTFRKVRSEGESLLLRQPLTPSFITSRSPSSRPAQQSSSERQASKQASTSKQADKRAGRRESRLSAAAAAVAVAAAAATAAAAAALPVASQARSRSKYDPHYICSLVAIDTYLPYHTYTLLERYVPRLACTQHSDACLPRCTCVHVHTCMYVLHIRMGVCIHVAALWQGLPAATRYSRMAPCCSTLIPRRLWRTSSCPVGTYTYVHTYLS